MNEPTLGGMCLGDMLPSASDGYRLVGHLSPQGAHRRIKARAPKALIEVGRSAGVGAIIEEDQTVFFDAWPRGAAVVVDIDPDIGVIMVVARSGSDFMLKSRLCEAG